MQKFSEPYLRFSVEIPDSWKYLPPAWSPVEQMKRGADADAEIQLASKPFCVAMQHHDSQHHAYATLQVTARPLPLPGNERREQILAAQLAQMASVHWDFVPTWSTHEAILSGHCANIIHGRFTLRTQPAEDILSFGVLSRSHTVFARGYAFTVALSGSDEPGFHDESDFDRIIQSIRIGG